MRSGVIYDANINKPHGVVNLSMPLWKSLFYSGMRITGASITSFSMATLIFIYGPIGYKQFQALTTPFVYAQTDSTATEQVSPQKVTNQKNKFPIDKQEAMQAILSGEFSINIPAINAKANIVTNVDPFNEDEYKNALKEGIAHAKDTGLPGEGKTIYLFAHSTDSAVNILRYNAVFYRLIELKKGSSISIFYNNSQYDYEVENTYVVGAKDIDWLKTYNKEELILQTCYPPGTTLKRFIVVAKKI